MSAITMSSAHNSSEAQQAPKVKLNEATLIDTLHLHMPECAHRDLKKCGKTQ